MSVILLILKIIGCILLVLLALVLLILACVLLIPARYRIQGRFLEERTLCIQVNWLFRLVSYSYVKDNGESSGGIRICGIRLKKREREEKEEREAWEDDVGGEAVFGERDEAFLIESGDSEEGNAKDGAGNKDTSPTGEKTSTKDARPQKSDEPGESPREEKSAKEQTFFARIESFFGRLRNTASRIREAFAKAKGIIADESNKIVLGSVWTELLYLLGHFKIRHIRADVRFSLADPAATGQALGVLCMMPFLYGQEVNIVPDFEAEHRYAEGEVEASGRVRGVHVLVSLVRLIRQKEVRSLIKRLRK